MTFSFNEFHISKTIRDACNFSDVLFSSSGNIILSNISAVREFQLRANEYISSKKTGPLISAGELNAMGLLDEIFHIACYAYRRQKYPDAFKELLNDLNDSFGREKIDGFLLKFMEFFPPTDVYKGNVSAKAYLDTELVERRTGRVRTNREQTLEEFILLHLANENPALKQFKVLFGNGDLMAEENYNEIWTQISSFFKKLPYWGTFGHDLISFLKEPVLFSPDNIKEQLDYVRIHWADLLLPGEGEGEDYWLKRLFGGIDILNEEWKPKWQGGNAGTADMSPPNYDYLMKEYERFSDDKEWMPKVVLMAKTVLVWLYQLSQKYNRQINTLDQIPDEELDALRDEGFTGLWLIGLWERSKASRTIKQICGNPEAAASAYSLDDYEIASNLGGWSALENLRTRLWQRGIRLASDMVPNHTGLDSRWIVERPDLFMQRRDNPFPQYTFNGPNLSTDGRVSVFLEDHYYSKSDCAVCFKRVDNATGDVRYIYHGNDGTGMPWNDTAQIDFLNPAAREEVIQKILHVARNFPIIRFDAAMVLAKKHIKRLWYPEPGKGGDIATRGQYALSAQEFENAIPQEFWREVVDRVAKEVPDTLLLAEAFWMMEGYFTRTLGMHRVYNSAFMNMLKKEENEKYRSTVKNTISFDPQILKRYVNFMNNPDEETAVAQFGKGDKYFGVCTLMSTMPGLPMFGHGQIEGFEEKYGMEYMRAYRDEKPDQYLVDRHKREIFPLLKKRYIFAEVENFLFYDVWNNGSVNENIFAYSNCFRNEYSLVFYNNKYERAAGWIKQSCPYAVKTGSGENDKKLVTRTISEGLGLLNDEKYFTIFREQLSGLWYVRHSTDICTYGFFISLNGFETQIFLDIHQEYDVDGKFAELCAYLNGKGTPNLEEAWQELKYRELYDSLKNVFQPELFDEFEKIETKKITAKTVFDLTQKKLTDFYTLAEKFALEETLEKIAAEEKRLKAIAEKEKAENSPAKTAGKSKKQDSTAKKQPEKQIKLPVPKQIFPAAEKQLSGYKRRLTAILGALKAKTPADESEKLLSNLAGKSKYKAEMMIAASMIAAISEKGFAKKWALHRKLAEILNTHYETDTGAQDFFYRLFVISEADILSCVQKKDFASIAEFLVNGENSWALTGANEFNGVRWFNKERMDSALDILNAEILLKTPEISHEEILPALKALKNAKDGAEFKCENFTALLTPKGTRKSASKKKKEE